MNKLNVFYERRLVGTLYRNSDLVYSFLYSDEWLKWEGAFQLSLAMPFQHEAFGNKITLSFFENLLPEGEARDALNKNHDTSSTYEFLNKFGNDCAGAIIVTKDEESPFGKSENNTETIIPLRDIYKAIDEKRSVAEVIANIDSGYLSIAGAQDKFTGIYRDGEFYLPKKGFPSTHIIKVPIYRSRVKESVYNEYYCMRLARLVGLNIPECCILDHEEKPLYVIERYDREIHKVVKRVHQQDFCQAQGIVTEYKYEARGGPSLKDNYQLIKSNVTITQRSKAMFDYLDWICFNLLVGNNDSHSKNISFVIKNGKIELAPFYDLLCTAIYPSLKNNFSFKIGGRDDASQIGRNQFELVDRDLGLKVGTMGKRAIEMAKKLLLHKDILAQEVCDEFSSTKIVKRISTLIGKRCESLNRQGL